MSGIPGNLNNNYAAAYNSSFSGGGFATPASGGNSILNMFLPSHNIKSDMPPILDPYMGQQRSRETVDSTASIVDLGEIVTYRLQSDNENFIQREILPLVPWGTNLRTFTWAVWDFPQMEVRETPETAPPRYGSSAQARQTTTMRRWAVGQHMSDEYGRTARGQANQRHNLTQIEYSVGLQIENMDTVALFNCQAQSRDMLEKLNKYTRVNVEEALLEERNNFCLPQKEERGLQLLWEAIKRKMALWEGSATSIIMTNYMSTLVLAHPELIEYSRAGEAGVALAKDPQRSFFKAGGIDVKIYYTRQFPQRVGADLSPWQAISQIGNYHKSMEHARIAARRQCPGDYKSSERDVSIYDQESDAMQTITITDMIEHLNIWKKNGTLRAVNDPPVSDRPVDELLDTMDFLSLDPDEVITFDTLDDAFTSAGGGGSNNSGSNKRRPGSKRNPSIPSSLEIFGQLKEKDFDHASLKRVGAIMAARVLGKCGTNCGTSAQASVSLASKISAGLALYERMSRMDFDAKFVDFALKNHARDLYQSRVPGAILAIQSGTVGGETVTVFQDAGATSKDDVYRKTATALLKRDPQTSTNIVRGKDGVKAYIPLPLGTEADFPAFPETRRITNLSGYASIAGFRAMADAYHSNNPIVQQRYVVGDLLIAAEFIEALESYAQSASTICPDAQCFSNLPSGKTPVDAIGESLFNMRGPNLWMNLRKIENVVLDPRSAATWNTLGVTNPGQFMGVDHADLFAIAERVKFGTFYQNYIRAALGRYYSPTSSGEVNYITELGKSLNSRFASVKATDYTDALGKAEIGGGNYVASTKQKLLDIVQSWVSPTLVRADANGDGVVTINARTGINTLVGIANNVDWLSLSSPFVNVAFIPLFGPLRLRLFSAVIQAVILACRVFTREANLPKLINAILKFNLLMLPSVEDVNVIDAGGNVSPSLVEDNLNNDQAVIHAPQRTLVAIRNANYPPPGAETGLNRLYQQFLILLDNVFGGITVKGLSEALDALKASLEVSFAEQLTFININGDTVLPFLRDLSTSDAREPTTIPDTVNLNGNISDLMLQLFFNPDVNWTVDKLGVRWKDTPDNFGVSSPAMIGARSGITRSVYGGSVDDYTGDGDSLDTDDLGADAGLKTASFFRTSLTIPSDQLPSLFAKNSPQLSKNMFDLRVDQPGDPTNYINIDAQDDILTYVNQLHTTSPKQLGQFGASSKTDTLKWKDIPWYSIKQRMGTTYFGPLSNPNHRFSALASGLSIKANYTKSFVRSVQYIDSHCDDLERISALIWMTTPFTKSACLSFVVHNITIPFNIDLIRPHMNYLMDRAIITNTGTENLGFTAVAHQDYTVGHTVLTKEMNGHLSYWAEPIIMRPQNCFPVDNMVCVSYGPGAGIGWFDPKDYDPNSEEVASYTKPSPSSGPSRSLMALVIPFTENHTADYISTSGKLQQLEDGHGGSRAYIPSAGDNKLHYSTADRYQNVWNWRYMQDTTILQTFGEDGRHPLYNKILWGGFTTYTDCKGKTKFATLNKSGWGPNVGPGCQAIYSGLPKQFPNFRYTDKYEILA